MKRIIALFLAIVVMFSFVITLSSCGTQGDKGDQGIQGEKGDKGDPGIGITNVEIVDGQLVITYSDGTVKNLGNIVAEETGTQGLAYYPLPDGTYGVTAGTTQYLETVEIPATYKGKAVTQILKGAFQNATNLKNIVIPDSMTSIGDSAFYGCSSLTSVAIPNGVTSIGSSAFRGCSSLTDINFNGTKAEWNTIEKWSIFGYETGNYTIYCTDGNITE